MLLDSFPNIEFKNICFNISSLGLKNFKYGAHDIEKEELKK